MDQITFGMTIGAVVGLSMFLVKLFDYFLYRNRGNQKPCIEQMDEIKQAAKIILATDFKTMEIQTSRMWELHNKTDEDGVPVWYVRRSLEEAIRELALNIQQQGILFQKLIERLDRQEAIKK